MKERERALAVSTLFGFTFNFIVGQVTKGLFSWSQGGMFLIYGLLNVFNCFFVLTFIKETKGVQLEKIPGLFGPVDGENAKLMAWSITRMPMTGLQLSKLDLC